MFYFVRPRARAILPSVSFPPVLAASRLFRHVLFSSLSRIRFFRVFVRPLGRLTPFSGAKTPSLPLPLGREETHSLSGWAPEQFSFCYFIQLFREGGILLLPGRATPVFSGQ